MADEQRPNGHGYGGDEEFTPSADTPTITAEARSIADLAVAFSTAASRLWESAQLLDRLGGDQRRVLVTRLITDLPTLGAGVADAIEALKGMS